MRSLPVTYHVAMTVTNRPEYFEEVLASWAQVRLLQEVSFTFALEPTHRVQENIAHLARWYQTADPGGCEIIVNPYLKGVSRNPYDVTHRVFESGAGYVLLAEDDLIVSDDIVEYHRWAMFEYAEDSDVACVLSFTHDERDEAAVHRDIGFGPWVWGTWANRWYGYVGAEWDVNQEFYTGQPGNEVGWDYHLNKRILPRLDKICISPEASRSNSIGLYGAHSSPETHVTAEQFKAHRPSRTDYFERV